MEEDQPTRRSCSGRGSSHQHEAEAGGQNKGVKTKVTNKEKTTYAKERTEKEKLKCREENKREDETAPREE